MDLCFGMLTKEGQGTDSQRHRFPKGQRGNIMEDKKGAWRREKKKKKAPYFHSMAMTFRAGKWSKRDIN